MEFVYSILITACLYMAFPIIFAALRKKPLKKNSYRWVCIAEGVIMYIFISVMYFVTDTEGIPSLVALVLWSSIGYKIGVSILRKSNQLIEPEFKKNEWKEPVEENYEITSDDYKHKLR